MPQVFLLYFPPKFSGHPGSGFRVVLVNLDTEFSVGTAKIGGGLFWKPEILSSYILLTRSYTYISTWAYAIQSLQNMEFFWRSMFLFFSPLDNIDHQWPNTPLWFT